MDHRFVELRLTLQHAPVFPHCKVLESTLLSLWTACPCERELNLNHLAARCITASLAPLRRDLSLLHESTPDIRREVGQGGRCLKAWTPDVFAQCQAAGFLRGVSHRLGVGEGIQKRKVSFRMWCQVLTILWTMAERKQQRNRNKSGITDRSISHK